MNTFLFQQLHAQGFISDQSFERIKHSQSNKLITVNYELKTLMYVGILLLTTGLGIIIYNNLDSIGHLAIVLFIAVATIACFSFCLTKAAPFTVNKSGFTNQLYDYILLLGSLLLLILVAWIQFQYQVFGNRWGMATFIPMVLLFATAYYFDHLAILSMAIVNLAAWAGITVTPLKILENNDFSSSRIIYTGLALGVLLIVAGYISIAKHIKTHFRFTYKNFGTHILFISAIAAIIHFEQAKLLWFIPLVFITAYQFMDALKEKSFYFLVITTLYFYVGFSYIVVNGLLQLSISERSMYAILFYFIISGIGLALFLVNYNKQLKRNDSL